MLTLIRVVLAGLVGGVIVFCAGAFSHAFLELEGQRLRTLPKDAAIREFLTERKVTPGIYRFPDKPDVSEGTSDEERDAEWLRQFKKGPTGLLIIWPTDEEPMGPEQLIGEFISNVVAALIVAWIISQTAPGNSYAARWIIVLLFGLFTWLATSFSNGLWWRFPWDFIVDGLICSLIEWSAAGFVIAAIAWPCGPCAPASATTPPLSK